MVVGVHSDTLSSSRDVRPSMVIPCVTVSFPKRNHAVPAPWFWRGEEGGEGGIPSSANIEQVPIIKHLSPSTEIRPLKTIQLRNINLPWRAPSPKKCRCGGDYPGVRDERVSGNEPECLGVGRVQLENGVWQPLPAVLAICARNPWPTRSRPSQVGP